MKPHQLRERFKFILTGIILFIIIFSCGRKPPPAEFSATFTISENENTVISGTLYVDGWRYRMNISQENERISIIVNRNSEWTWLLMPDKKMCTYLADDDPENIASDPFLGLRYLESEYDREFVGNVKIDGYECAEYLIKDDSKKLMTYWESTALRFPIKIIEHSITDIATELSGIIEGDIDDTVFTIPKDYTIVGQRWTP